MGAHFSQFFPSQPICSADNIGSQKGKVFLITGGYSGIGLELSKILYKKGGKVFIAGRSTEKAQQAMHEIESLPTEDGSVHFLALELDDLRTIKESAFRNPPLRSQSKQGYELQLATNCLGPFLFTQLLLPLIEKAVEENRTSAPATGRVIWLSSQIMELSAPQGAVVMSDLKNPPKDQTHNYVTSKTINFLLASELARRGEAFEGHHQCVHESGCGKYSTVQTYSMDEGRISTSVRVDLIEAAKTKDEGGTGRATDVGDFCEQITCDYA